MGSKGSKTKAKKNLIKLNDNYKNIKSIYILEKIFNNLETKRRLNLIKHNKKLKKKLDININDYKEASEIEIELKTKYVPGEFNYLDEPSEFINIKKEDENYYHIYFNDDKEEIKRKNINKNEGNKIIKIIIDY